MSGHSISISLILIGSHLGHFVGGIHTVVAAVVEKVAHGVRLKDLDDALQVRLLVRFELVATGADGARRGRGA